MNKAQFIADDDIEIFEDDKPEEDIALSSWRRKKILVVEDNPINRQILCKILEDKYETIQAENGKYALEKLDEYGDDIILILLDIIMPEMDGYTFLSLVRENSEYAAIPIIVTTSNDSEEDEVKALTGGATDYIRKPYRPQIVRHRVDSIIAMCETAGMVNSMKYDQLTGIFSKEYFYKLAAETIEENPGIYYDIICSDIENFSLINDMFGHRVGNELLCLTALMLSDASGKTGVCGRINADTFAMLMERPLQYDEAWFEEYISKLNTMFQRCRVRLDFGIYRVEDTEISIDSACDRALSAIESIKGNITRNHAFYDDSIRQEKLRTQTITDNMEYALSERQFVLHYQPKYDLQSEEVVGAEALVRWLSPEDGLLMPGQFVPLFEQNGFITQLDKYVWEEACALIRRCKDLGIPVVPISVNVSRADLHNPELPHVIEDMINKYEISPDMLHLEITESAYTDQPEVIIEAVSKLRNMGIVIEMDDFGTGYSSLNMLNELPIDVLKLDIKFVQSNTEGNGKKSILGFVIGLAKWMDLIITAEGAETREQVDRLKALECDQVQGYYFTRPMPEENFIKLLEENGLRP